MDSAHLTPSQEDYLEAVYRISEEKKAARAKDIADRLNVRASSVTAALRTLAALELGSTCKLTNASDTDWLDCQKALRVVGLEVENLLNDWLVARWHTKHGKRARYD